MLDEDDRHVALGSQVTDQLHQSVSFLTGHTGGRLVQYQQLRIHRQCNGDVQTALVTVRKVGGHIVHLVFQSDQLQVGDNFFFQVGIPYRQDAESLFVHLDAGDLHVLVNGQVVEQLRDLKALGHALVNDLVGSQTGDILAAEDDLAAAGGGTVSNQVHQGGLTGTVGADDGANLTFGNLEGNVLGGMQSAKIAVEVFNLQNRFTHFLAVSFLLVSGSSRLRVTSSRSRPFCRNRTQNTMIAPRMNW